MVIVALQKCFCCIFTSSLNAKTFRILNLLYIDQIMYCVVVTLNLDYNPSYIGHYINNELLFINIFPSFHFHFYFLCQTFVALCANDGHCSILFLLERQCL